MAWVLLLIMTALAIVTFVTWRVLVKSVDQRMDAALSIEVEEFKEFTDTSINPTTGRPYTSVEEMIRDAIVHQVSRQNEYFLGYIDGAFYDSCLCPDAGASARHSGKANVTLTDDQSFTERVASVGQQEAGSYQQPELGEVRYLALPVTLPGDPAKGVIVAAFLADAERASADRAAQSMLLVGAATMLLATAAAWLVAGRILLPLRDVVETAHAITETDLSRRIPTRTDPPRDDIDRLVETINGMLDRVQSGVLAQRRFIDDAAHELRTPITIVRGHLDVLDTSDPDDIRDTVTLVDDELDRMNRMVADLLLLARAEQPSFLRLQPIEVGSLTRQIFAKVSQLGDCDFVLEAVAEVTSVLDPQRITQALVALTDNACRYAGDGDRGRIAIGSSTDGRWLRFWVADSGPGVSEEDRTRIFERFARGRMGGRRTDGAGLGLSIVAAIANAHGGRVEVESAPPSGAKFVAAPLGGAKFVAAPLGGAKFVAAPLGGAKFVAAPLGGAKFVIVIPVVSMPVDGGKSWPESLSPKTKRGSRRSSTKGYPPTVSASQS
jgi:signal transduction histidine kinase